MEVSTGHVSSVADREEKEEPEREVAAEPEQPFRLVTRTPRRRPKSKTANTTQSKTANTNQPPTTPPNSSPRPSAPNYTPISQEVGGAFSPLGGLLDGSDEQDAYDAQEETVQGTITEVDEPADSTPDSPIPHQSSIRHYLAINSPLTKYYSSAPPYHTLHQLHFIPRYRLGGRNRAVAEQSEECPGNPQSEKQILIYL